MSTRPRSPSTSSTARASKWASVRLERGPTVIIDAGPNCAATRPSVVVMRSPATRPWAPTALPPTRLAPAAVTTAPLASTSVTTAVSGAAGATTAGAGTAGACATGGNVPRGAGPSANHTPAAATARPSGAASHGRRRARGASTTAGIAGCDPVPSCQ